MKHPNTLAIPTAFAVPVPNSYAEALSLTLKKNGKELRSAGDSADAVRGPAGARPGGAVGEQVTVVAEVIGVNAKTHEVRLRGPNRTVDIHVEDPKQPKLIKVGDQVEAVYMQALALTVEPAPAKKLGALVPRKTTSRVREGLPP